ncbi:MAG: hypothetical protein AAGA58_10990 [Verrucomicrobiota bacterium]
MFERLCCIPLNHNAPSLLGNPVNIIRHLRNAKNIIPAKLDDMKIAIP